MDYLARHPKAEYSYTPEDIQSVSFYLLAIPNVDNEWRSLGSPWWVYTLPVDYLYSEQYLLPGKIPNK